MGATMNPAQRRLLADRDRLRALVAAQPEAVRVLRVTGDPPTLYEIELRCRGAEAPGPQGPIMRESHVVRVRLPAAYPISRPTVQVATPVWNPHVFANGMVCLGSEWSPGQGLDLFVRRLWQILVWDPAVIDPASPADGGPMAWYEANRGKTPFDRTDPTVPAAPLAASPRPGVGWNG